jgi:hypothetical protein
MVELPPDEFIAGKAGGEVDRVHVSLRAASDDLDPDELTRALGVRPTFAARKGERRLTRGGEAVQRTGVWYIQVPGVAEEWTLEEAIAVLLNRLPSEQEVWDALAKQHHLDLYCGLHLDEWNRGAELSPELLLRLAKQHLTLSLDMYFEGIDGAAP